MREKGEDSVNFGTDNHVACADCREFILGYVETMTNDYEEEKAVFFLKKYHATSSNEKPTSTHHQ